jgi:uncharacterized protein YoxC
MKTTEQVLAENNAWAENVVSKVTKVDTFFVAIEVAIATFISFMTFIYLFIA